jgi:hypothetical protein
VLSSWRDIRSNFLSCRYLVTVQELLCYALDLNPGPACGSKAFLFWFRSTYSYHTSRPYLRWNSAVFISACPSLPEDSNDSDSLIARESSAVCVMLVQRTDGFPWILNGDGFSLMPWMCHMSLPKSCSAGKPGWSTRTRS